MKLEQKRLHRHILEAIEAQSLTTDKVDLYNMDMKTSQAIDQLRQANYVKGTFHDILNGPIRIQGRRPKWGQVNNRQESVAIDRICLASAQSMTDLSLAPFQNEPRSTEHSVIATNPRGLGCREADLDDRVGCPGVLSHDS
jgi:hypothetical protein